MIYSVSSHSSTKFLTWISLVRRLNTVNSQTPFHGLWVHDSPLIVLLSFPALQIPPPPILNQYRSLWSGIACSTLSAKKRSFHSSFPSAMIQLSPGSSPLHFLNTRGSKVIVCRPPPPPGIAGLSAHCSRHRSSLAVPPLVCSAGQ